MTNENHSLLLELWSRVKSHVSAKERLEVADIFVIVFDEFGLIDDTIKGEELDKEMRAAISTLLGEDETEDDGEDDGYDN